MKWLNDVTHKLTLTFLHKKRKMSILKNRTIVSSNSIKEELTQEKLMGSKLWITAGPREKFTGSEVCV